MIPEDIEKWLSEAEYGSDWQDFDLSLADVQFFPLLKAYLNNPRAAGWKKMEVVSALLELLEHDCPHDGGPETALLAEDIRATIQQHADVVQSSITCLGPVKEVVLRSILGLPIPPEHPQWLVDEARKEGGLGDPLQKTTV